VLAKNPKAILLPRMGVSWPPEWWQKQHPDEIMKYDDGSRSTASIFSDVWQKDAVYNLKKLINHLEMKYGNSIIGYHPSGQHTGEWFFDRTWDKKLAGFEPPALDAFKRYLTDKYGSVNALSKAWNDPSITLQTVQLPSFKERTQSTAGSFRNPLLEQNIIDFYEFENAGMADVISLL
jgi:beta-galactosidase GanA